MTVAEPIELLGIDGVDMDAPLHQSLDHRAARNLDGDGDASGIAGQFAQPFGEFRNRTTGVREGALSHNPSFMVQDARLVRASLAQSIPTQNR